MVHLQTDQGIDVCMEDNVIVGLNVKTADGRVFVRLPHPEKLLEVLSKAIKECEGKKGSVVQ